MADQSNDTVTILHFNDVYNIEASDAEPVGGAARFVSAFKEREHLKPLVLFSGDIFNPSIMSVVTKGSQMVPVINALNIGASVYGNHDFDFGVDRLEKLAQQTTCPWLLSNVIDNLTGAPLAGGKTSLILECRGHKIGVVGLVESEWLMTLSTIDPEDVTFLDFVEEGQRLATELLSQGAEYIIALTHMRWPNDLLLAEKVSDINLVLGGHDHDYGIEKVNSTYVIKSGSDFRNFSELTVNFTNTGVDVDVQEITIDSSVTEDPEMKAIVKTYQDMMGEKMEKILGVIDVDLDGRFSSVRTQETNLGNFVTDIMLTATDADIALLNSGTLRSDRIHRRGNFKLKDLLAILPLVDPVIVLQVTGEQLYLALENSVSQYPKHEGRFAQIAGVGFSFDPDMPSNARIDKDTIQVQKVQWRPDKTYRLCTKQYLADGKDGYDVLKDAPILVNEEQGPRLSTIVQNHFKSVQILQGKKKQGKPLQHRQSIISTNKRKKLIRQMSFCEEESEHDIDDEIDEEIIETVRKVSLTYAEPDTAVPLQIHDTCDNVVDVGHGNPATLQRRQSMRSLETMFATSALAPRVEGRISMAPSQRSQSLPESVEFGL